MLESIFEDLPDDEELIFLKVEWEFREECGKTVFEIERNEEKGYVAVDQYLTYMRKTAAAATELGLGLQGLVIPPAENFALSDYRDFIGMIDEYRTAYQIRHARRAKGYSVRFDEKTKRIVTHHLNQVREIILKLEVDEWKKDSLLNCLNKLQTEVDKNRSGYEVLGAFIVESAGVLGDAGEKLEPIRSLIDSVAGLIWGTKHAEQTKGLPAPTERRQIPPPKSQLTRPKPIASKRSDMDDEIPF